MADMRLYVRVRKLLEQGHSREDISKRLSGSDYSQADIQWAFEEYDKDKATNAVDTLVQTIERRFRNHEELPRIMEDLLKEGRTEQEVHKAVLRARLGSEHESERSAYAISPYVAVSYGIDAGALVLAVVFAVVYDPLFYYFTVLPMADVFLKIFFGTLSRGERRGLVRINYCLDRFDYFMRGLPNSTYMEPQELYEDYYLQQTQWSGNLLPAAAALIVTSFLWYETLYETGNGSAASFAAALAVGMLIAGSYLVRFDVSAKKNS